MLPATINALGVAHEAVRQAWPDTLGAAIQSGQLERAHAVLSLLATRPKNDIPPYLLAHLARGHALAAAAEDRHDAVERDLRASIDGFPALGYRYWLAGTQTDLAAWLRSVGRRGRDAAHGGDRDAAGHLCQPSTCPRASRDPRGQRPARQLTGFPGGPFALDAPRNLLLATNAEVVPGLVEL
jgi:hypothetical protein